MMNAQETEFDMKFFNDLDGVEDANKRIAEDGFREIFLKKAALLMWKYNLQDSLGITLLHRHNELFQNEVMAETAMEVEGREALVTQPYAKDSLPMHLVSVRWAACDEGLIPLEYSNDPRAVSIHQEMQVPLEFIREYARLTKEHEAGKYFGLGIIKREFYDRRKEGESPLEHSVAAPRASVVWMEAEELASNNIVTSWSVGPKPESIERGWCEVKAIDYCKGLITCEQFCRDYGSDPHHTAHRGKKEHKEKTAWRHIMHG